MDNLQIELQEYNESVVHSNFDLDRIIYDLDSQIDLSASQADKLDYLISISSGIVCGLLDILWVNEFSLKRGRNIASEEVDNFVIKTAKLLGCKEDNLQSSVRFLEKKFPLPSDGNTSELGGARQHHLRDFAHHPTIAGLTFSLLTQFTFKSYGSDENGLFKIVDVTESSKAYIGKDIPSKIIYGTVTWFFHLVSDVAGSSSSAGLSGGTGIPGPLLSLAKEMSVLPFFKDITIGKHSLSVFLSKLFNGTLFMKRDENNIIMRDTIVKFDLRGEFGGGMEVGRQAIPVVANECIVRSFYFIRRLALEIQDKNIRSISDFKTIEWNAVKPNNNPTISRMLAIATGVFSTVDIGEAIVTQKYWVSINYVGVGRFAVAIGEDVAWGLKTRNLKEIREMYEDIKRYSYLKSDQNIHNRIGEDMSVEKFGLNAEQIEILYNIEYYKTLNDIRIQKVPINNQDIKTLKHTWLNEWKKYISEGFSSFLHVENTEMNWYTEEKLMEKINENDPQKTWFRLVLLEAMLFEPYYPLGTEKDKKGNEIPSRKYRKLQNKMNEYKNAKGDEYVETAFSKKFHEEGYIRRLRKCYDKVLWELNEVLKAAIKTLSITSAITVVTVATAGAFAPAIAVGLVGSNFAGLSGAALTAASLAYLGGGAVAVGGAGMVGGTLAIVGGGAVLGIGAGAGFGGVVGIASLAGKRNTILQSAKLLVSVREIFLNDEHNLAYSNSIYEEYTQKIVTIEKATIDLKHQAEEANSDEQKELKKNIKDAEESVKAMKIARQNLRRFISSFEEGMAQG